MKPSAELSAFDLIEESLALLRNKGLSPLSLYLIGTIPFITLFLFFWSDMARDSLAEERLPRYALALSVLYFWMKFWQTAFVRHLRYYLLNQTPPPWSWKQMGWCSLFQGTVQPTQWIALPLSKLLLFPFGYLHAFYETLHATGDGEIFSIRETLSKTWKNALFSPKQNHLLIWMMSPWVLIFGFTLTFFTLTLIPYIRPEFNEVGMDLIQSLWLYLLAFCIPFSPFGVLIFANVALIVFGAPFFLQTILGTDSAWTLGSFGFTDPFFLMVSLSLTFLIMDPILKTAYLLRDFYGRSLTSAEDLFFQMKKNRTLSKSLFLLILCGLLTGKPLSAEAITETQTPISQEEIVRFEKALQKISHQRDYTWRQERRSSLPDSEDEKSIFLKLWKSIKELSETFWSWISDFIQIIFNNDKTSEAREVESAAFPSFTRFMMILGIVLLILCLCGGLILYFRARRRSPQIQINSPVEIPDLECIHTLATDLPVNEWEKRALALMEKSEFRLAMRAWYLAGLALLHEQSAVRIRKGKSNADYLLEAELQFPHYSTAYQEFKFTTSLFEKVWYGFERSQLDEAEYLQRWVSSLRGGRL